MIRKEQVRIGMRIVGDDPESPESYPYKGTVTALCETGRNETDFYIVIKLDGESMRQPEISRCCPEGIMRCFPWTVSPEEKRNNIPSTDYTAVETSRGFLFFTHTEEGRRSLREFLQEMADTYFEPSFDLGPVWKVYLLNSLRSIRRKSPLRHIPTCESRRISGWMSVTGTG